MSGTSLGLIIYASVKPIFKIYFIIGLGFWMAKKNILSVSTCRDMSDLVITAIMPCLIFENIVINLKSSDIKNLGILFLTGFLLFLTGLALAVLNYFVTKSPRRWLGGLLSVGLFPNISDLPIAYLQTLSKGDVVFDTEDGDKGVAYVCIFLASQVLMQFCFGLYKLIEWDFREDLIPNKIDEEEVSSEDEKIGLPKDHANDETSIASSTGDDASEPNRSLEQMQHNEFLRVHELAKSTSNARSVHSNEATTRRRGSIGSASVNTNFYSVQQVRTTDLRKQKTQDMDDVINEYSEFGALKNHEIQRVPSGIVTGSAAPVLPVQNTSPQKGKNAKEERRAKIVSNLKTMGKNFLSPNSLSLIISLAIAMSPPLKALFVATNFHMPSAPDEQPPLSFLIDLTSYVGAASVPIGLLLLGATISRLKVKSIPPGFWKTAVMVTGSRLILLPMIGVGITTGFHKLGWYSDKIVRFVSVLEFGLPSATSLVYFTAFYTDPNSDDHLQMDCLAICLIAQYSILYITLPFLVTFTFKVSLGY